MSIEPLTLTTAIITLSNTLKRVITLLSDFAKAEKKVNDIRKDCALTQKILDYIQEQLDFDHKLAPLFIDAVHSRTLRPSKAGANLERGLRETLQQLQLDLNVLIKEIGGLTEPCSKDSKLGSLIEKGRVAWKMSYLEGVQKTIATKRRELEMIRYSLSLDRDRQVNHPNAWMRPAIQDGLASFFCDLAFNMKQRMSKNSIPFPPPSCHAQEMLVKAIKAGNKGEVEEFLQKITPNFQLVTKEEYYPLHIAAQVGDLAMIELLISYGARVDCCALDGETPLLTAIKNGNPAAAKGLIRAGADVSQPNGQGKTPLHLAAFKNMLSVVEGLLDKGADPRVQDRIGRTPLMETVSREERHLQPQDTRVLQALLARSSGTAPTVGTTTKQYNPIHEAAAAGHLRDLQIMIQHAGSAAENGSHAWNCLDYLDRPPLWFAARHGQLEILKYLVSLPEININHPTRHPNLPTALWVATTASGQEPATCDPRCLSHLLSSGADPNVPDCNGLTLFHKACHSGNLPLARTLLSSGADPWLPDKLGMLPIHHAARSGHLPLIVLILDSGAAAAAAAADEIPLPGSANDGVNAVDGRGTTPLMYACESGHDHVVAYLVESGAAVAADAKGKRRVKDHNGCDCFYFAVARGHLHVASYLLPLGADINGRTSKGNTPLHVACRTGNPEMVSWLLRMRADAGAKSWEGFTGMEGVVGTPVDIARAATGVDEERKREVVRLMEGWERGGKTELLG